LNKWLDLFQILCDKTCEPSFVAVLYCHRLDNLKDAGEVFTADSILSIIVHCSIAHGTNLRNKFDLAIDRKLSVDREVPLSFNDHIYVLTACQEKV
jgi:hypothetical protein